MDIIKKYVVYELNKVMDSKKHLALKKVEFNGYIANSFDSEEEAIQTLINEELHFIDFVILTEVRILNY